MAAIASPGGVPSYGPYDRFPLKGTRRLPEASFEAYTALHRRLGFGRGVLTQPTDYGTDNACLLDAVARSAGTVKGVVALTPEALGDAEIARLDAIGIRGVRLRDLDEIGPCAERLRGTGWHLEVVPRGVPGGFVALAPRLERLGVPVVFGHRGIRMSRPAPGRHPSARCST